MFRSLLAAIMATPKAIYRIFSQKAPLPPAALPNSDDEVTLTFSGTSWARAFVARHVSFPNLSRNESGMAEWFTSALMCGYKEARKDDGAELVGLRGENEAPSSC